MVSDESCIFCKIAKKEIKTEIFEESENFLCFPDNKPKTKGHCLIIPKKHFANLMDLPVLFGNELLGIIKKVAEKRLREGNDGFNLAINNGKEAGQVVMHAHFHLIPRKKEENV